MIICKRCIVSGRVQGVFFRFSTQQQANALHIHGWAKNLTDGRVEVVACGENQHVQTLCQWLLRGPSYAQVDEVHCSDTEIKDHSEFLTL